MKRFTDDEVEYIMENMNSKSILEVANYLGRCYEVVARRMRKIRNHNESFIAGKREIIKKELIELYIILSEELDRIPGQRDFNIKRKSNKDFPTYDHFIKYFENLFNLYKESGLSLKYSKSSYDMPYWYDFAHQFKGKYGIYKIQNILNKKIYIGQAKDLNNRLIKGYFNLLPKGRCHSILLQRDWDLYGLEYFEFSVQEFCDIEDLDNRETYWIDFYKSYDNRYGYNIKDLGVGSNKCFRSPESIERMRINATGEKNPMFGKTHTPEARRKISDAQSISIYQYDRQGNLINKYNTVKEASIVTGIPTYCIIQSQEGKVGLGTTGFFWINENDHNSGNILEIINKRIEKYSISGKIIQLDKNKTFIAKYDNQTQAQKATGANNIWWSITTGGKSLGFYWVKANQYEN